MYLGIIASNLRSGDITFGLCGPLLIPDNQAPGVIGGRGSASFLCASVDYE